MLTIDMSATRAELARYDRRQARLKTLCDEIVAHTAVADYERAGILGDRHYALSLAARDRLYSTVASDLWCIADVSIANTTVATIRVLAETEKLYFGEE